MVWRDRGSLEVFGLKSSLAADGSEGADREVSSSHWDDDCPGGVAGVAADTAVLAWDPRCWTVEAVSAQCLGYLVGGWAFRHS